MSRVMGGRGSGVISASNVWMPKAPLPSPASWINSRMRRLTGNAVGDTGQDHVGKLLEEHDVDLPREDAHVLAEAVISEVIWRRRSVRRRGGPDRVRDLLERKVLAQQGRHASELRI